MQCSFAVRSFLATLSVLFFSSRLVCLFCQYNFLSKLSTGFGFRKVSTFPTFHFQTFVMPSASKHKNKLMVQFCNWSKVVKTLNSKKTLFVITDTIVRCNLPPMGLMSKCKIRAIAFDIDPLWNM